MLKKLTVLAMLVCFITLQACGTIFKQDQIGKPHSNKLDIGIVALDAIGLILFIVPGVIAFTVDYINGTLFLPNGKTAKLEDTSPENIQKILAENNIKVSLTQLYEGKTLALNKK